MKTKELMDIVLKAGEILLRSGAEIYRVEDTINRIFKAYNAECDCFVLLTGIFITAKSEGDEAVSLIKRINGISFDLHRIELANSFSRHFQANHPTYGQSMKILNTIEKAITCKYATQFAMAGGTGFVYTLLFKGTISEALIVTAAGTGVGIVLSVGFRLI